MSNVELGEELRRTMRVQSEAVRISEETSRHLGDRMEGFLAALSFTPVEGEADAALRAHHLTALIEGVMENLEADAPVDPAFLRLGWRLADRLTAYLETRSGVGIATGRQTREMEDLLRRAG